MMQHAITQLIYLWLLREVETEIYGSIERQIVEARQQEERAIASSNQWVEQLMGICQDFNTILASIAP